MIEVHAQLDSIDPGERRDNVEEEEEEEEEEERLQVLYFCSWVGSPWSLIVWQNKFELELV